MNRNRMRSVIPLAGAAALLLAAPAMCQPAASSPTASGRYELFGTFELMIDGKPDPSALLYHVERPSAVLVRSQTLGMVSRVVPAARQVQLYEPAALQELAGGAVVLAGGAPIAGTVPYTIEGDGPAWQVGAKRAQLRVRPPLLGVHQRAGLVAHDRTYELRSAAYQTIPQYLAELRSLSEPLRVRVFFGSWCSTCAQLLPHILKVEQELAGTTIRFEYYGLPQGYDEPEAKRLQISSVPTGILYRGDRQVGRIEPSSFRFPELAIKNALSGLTRVPLQKP